MDIEGSEVRAGDRIATAFREGNVAVLRLGTVVAVLNGGENIEVRWESASPGGSIPARTTIISLERTVRL